MDFEPWWLIFLPLLFALGWIAAKVDLRQMLSETRSLPNSYFKGLNFLLNEEPDRAIDAFVEVAKLDPETTELHFALGSLFRRRGEMERAIRVHQSLLSRADLQAADRESAQHELAQDFLKAGMLDRAEQAFERVLDTRFAVPAVRALIRIYESEHDWPRAIEAVKRLRALVDEPVPQLVHYQCERAVAALALRPPDIDAASAALDAADNAAVALRKEGRGQASEARIAILRAQLARAANHPERERAYLASVLDAAPEYASLIAADLLESYRSVGQQAEGLAVLKAHYLRFPSLDTFNVVFRELRAQEGYQPAWAFAREALRAHPSLLGLDRLLEAELATGDSASVNLAAGADLSLLRSLIHKHTQRLDRYSCRICGFEARHFYWQCPGCNSWETYEPRRLEEIK
ncbi:lipopolysaccharide assembly protein LapB [Pollutimonas thiosulfatoxidans]|uniref:Lipopolysaccharide assembly protein B n=1 Tax=Pollutimonas thiosulfatoxidans TaxID=2028345 RepID=A0A410GBH9_9BURK|nr:lipopolysaccharide assembly protein LapB [Pollutimonas thiosulfatoxidans]MBF6616155.1 lipopolysaccharide assembly protein LapB [Candidimonas sp.]NYT46158.1 lipopolysaccharide assembly protein LapB [Alcaligenaceae bacterium]QAA93650.1 lipopolysaccharide assembly protein LapB [Pollutimonas thiosulfatoxidans]